MNDSPIQNLGEVNRLIEPILRKYEKLDREIDEAIYKLYGLSAEEINTIENEYGRK
jgi:uncharacterized protein YfbU (UPF0304 family)